MTVEQLQESWNDFCTKFQVLVGEAGSWLKMSDSSGVGMVGNLVQLSNSITAADSTVQLWLGNLQIFPPGSDSYKKNALTGLQKKFFSGEDKAFESMNGSVETLSANLANGASELNAAANGGVLKKLIEAYANEVAALEADVEKCKSEITKDNAQIIADGFGAGVALGLGIVGMINFWNPIGWLAMAGGAVGANYAIKAIESLKKVDVASLKETIKKKTSSLKKRMARRRKV